MDDIIFPKMDMCLITLGGWFSPGHIEICVPLAVTCRPPIRRGPQASRRYLKKIAGVTGVMQIFKKVSVDAIINCRPTIEMETQGSILVNCRLMPTITEYGS